MAIKISFAQRLGLGCSSGFSACAQMGVVFMKLVTSIFSIVLILLSAPIHAAAISERLLVGENFGSSVAFGQDGTRYVGGADGNLHAIGPLRDQWTISLGGEIGSTPAIDGNGSLFVGSNDGVMYAVDLGSQEKAWSFDSGSAIYTSPAISSDGYLYFGNKQGQFFALDSRDGTILWSRNLGAEVGGSPAIGPSGTVYIGTGGGTLHALDSLTGEAVFEYHAIASFPLPYGVEHTQGVSSPAVDWQGNVYFGAYDQRLISLRKDGSEIWEIPVFPHIASSPVIAADGSVVAVTYYGRVYYVSPNGDSVVQYRLDENVYSSPAIASDGSVIVATTSGRIVSIDFSGEEPHLNWEISGNGAFYSSVTISPSGDLMVVSSEGELVSVSSDSSGTLLTAQWPMFGLNDRHTGYHPDDDVDGCPDAIDVFSMDSDRCLDTDGDGVADVYDEDMDGDGIPNEYELKYGMEPLVADADQDLDGDGYSNEFEYEYGLDPSVNEIDHRSMAVVESYSLDSFRKIYVHPENGHVLAVKPGQIKVYQRDTDTGTLEELSSQTTGDFNILELGFSDDGQHAYAYGYVGPYDSSVVKEIRHYNWMAGSGLSLANVVGLRSWEGDSLPGAEGPYEGSGIKVSNFVFSPDGGQLYLGTDKAGIMMFDRDDQSGMLSFRGHYLNGGELFDASHGLVVNALGSKIFVQGRDEQWVVSRDGSGDLSSDLLLKDYFPSNPTPGIVSGLSENTAIYLFSGYTVVETDQNGIVADGPVDARYGWVFSDPVGNVVYTYNSSTLSAYHRDQDVFKEMAVLTGNDKPDLKSLVDAKVSPDGKNIYAVSSSENRLVVLTTAIIGLGRPYIPPELIDTDSDGLPDVWETANGLNPDDPSDVDLDADGDGLSNWEEYSVYETKANEPDSDGDGMNDGWEVEFELDPTSAADRELDADGDGFSNIEEFQSESDPRDAEETPASVNASKMVPIIMHMMSDS